jgi:Fur family ferric uptake transcriptional regulator
VTEPAASPARSFGDIEEVFALLRSEGHRVTAPTRFVLEALFAADEPISAQRIAETTPVPEFEASSVYRNLERLEELGVVKHVHLGHSPSLYMLVGGGAREFLLCERCGKVTSVDPAELEPIRRAVEDRFGYRASFGHFPIVGVCADCARR